MLLWHALVAYAEPEVLTPLVPFQMRCLCVPSSRIRPVTPRVAWLPENVTR